MKSPLSNSIKYTPLKHFLFRIPALPYSFIDGIRDPLDRDYLLELFSKKEIAEAIYYASPSLYSEIQTSITQRKTLKERAAFSLYRYIERMAVRCTPFGLFSTVSIGVVDATIKRSSLFAKNAIIAHRYIDAQFSYELSQYIRKCPDLRSQIRFFSNNTIYRVGQTFRYIEPEYIGGHISYKLTSTAASEYLTVVIEQSKDGILIEDLITLLVSMDVDPDSAQQFVLKAIDSSILIAETDVTVTGTPYHLRLESLLEKMSNSDIRDRLLHLLSLVSQSESPSLFSSSPIDGSIPFQEDQSIVKNYHGNLVRIDSERKAVDACLGEDVLNDLSSIFVIYPIIAKSSFLQTIEDFKKAFKLKYDQQEIPLEVALDPELGIGYPVSHGICDTNVLTDNLLTTSTTQKRHLIFEELERIVINKMGSDLSANESNIIRLSEGDLKNLTVDHGALPSTIGVLFQIVNPEGSDYQINIQAVSSVPANIISRFGHLDNEFRSLISEIVEEEDRQSKVINADIVHLPDARMGNIISRPHSRKYEILLNILSDCSKDTQIPVSDLMISIRDGEIVLTSQRHRKRIFPKQNNAHNYKIRATPIYRFLCDLQYQGVKSIFSIPVNGILDLYGCSPRVVFHKLILSPAMWQINKEDFLQFMQHKDATLIEEISLWRTNKHIPRLVTFSQGDNELLIDFMNPGSIRALFPIIKKGDKLLLKEFLFDPNYLLAHDENNSLYTNECFIPFSLNHN